MTWIERRLMKPFGKEFYRALLIGFLLGSAGMALTANGIEVSAKPTTVASTPAQHR